MSDAIQPALTNKLITAFPWYDLPSVKWAHRSLFNASGLPGTYRDDLHHKSLWSHPDLLLTQACGLDLFCTDAPIEPVAAPVFDLECEPGHYYSYLIGNLGGNTAAVNSVTSRSGLSALLLASQPQKVLITGSHLRSLLAVQSGRADVAAIDAVTWQILARDQPDVVRGLRIIQRSTSAPAPPYVARREADPAALLSALQHAMRSKHTRAARHALFVRDVVGTKRSDYLSIQAEYERALRALHGCEIAKGDPTGQASPTESAA